MRDEVINCNVSGNALILCADVSVAFLERQSSCKCVFCAVVYKQRLCSRMLHLMYKEIMCLLC